MLRQGNVTTSVLAVALSLGLGSAMAATASRQEGGYGPIRLGMTEADAKHALDGIAHEVSALSKEAMDDGDEATLAKMAVAVPWEDSYVGRLDPTTKMQFGVHDGRVVTVMLRTTLSTQGQGCRDAFAALVRRNDAQFGPVQVADMASNPAAFTDGNASFAGWTLSLSRMEMEPGICNLAADYTSDADKGIEARWRASQR